MSIVVVGSIAFDTIKTPHGSRERSLGGAANYFAMAAKFFTSVKMVGVVGEDYPTHHMDYLRAHNVDVQGITVSAGKSFHWQGEYTHDFAYAKTISTELNVFEHFCPSLPDQYRDSPVVFLANIDPELQAHVLKQMTGPKIKALDSMNFWIARKNAELKKVISMIDILFINDAEIRELTGEHNIIKAVKGAFSLGAKIVVIKRGEHGALLATDNFFAFVPAFPVEHVVDPTGAGDAFAGGFLGYLASRKDSSLPSLKQALLAGTAMSSFAIEQFSFDRLKVATEQDVQGRINTLKSFL